ncbi:phosphomannomutase [Neorhizobium sp. DAR64872/K0K18]|uniref:phosphomannomutase n=1 Tax=Neorhizobium sp. DAR64872/K0K18 TaxID=3421958 RepID=UPI003D2C47A7
MKFGTSGLRGLVTDLEGRNSARYAQAFANYLLQSGLAQPGDCILVGRDFRASSPGIAATCIGALQRAGMRPLDCGPIPTPAVAAYSMSLRAACLMITGSHIPDDRNGIKFYRPDGEIDKHDEAAITAIADELDKQEINSTPSSAPECRAEAEKLFVRRNATLLPVRALSALKIGVYQHSSVARDMFVSLLESYGAQVVPLGRSGHFVPVDTEAVSPETISLLAGWCKDHALDAIVSADGDGDRPLVTDENGKPLRGDLLGLIGAKLLGADAIVTPVTSNSAIEASGVFAVFRTKVGSPFVIAGMQEALNAGYTDVVGFEANGGTLNGSRYVGNGGYFSPLPTRDSFLPVLASLHLRAERREPLSSIVGSFGLASTAAGRLENFPVISSAALMKYLRASEQNLETFFSTIGPIASTSDIDGMRVTLRDGRIVHLRPSGNAPEMRCYVEAETDAGAEALLNAGLALINHWHAAREPGLQNQLRS